MDGRSPFWFRMFKLGLYLFVICLSNISGQAQVQTSLKDSLMLMVLDSVGLELKRFDDQQQSDSIRILLYREELGNLKEGETSKRRLIEERLRKLLVQDSVIRVKNRELIGLSKKLYRGVPVVPFRDTLFYLYNRVQPLTIIERVDLINRRIREVETDYPFEPDSVMAATSESFAIIHYKTKIVMNISRIDAFWANRDRDSLTRDYLTMIRRELIRYHEERRPSAILRRIFLGLVTIAVFIFLLRGLSIGLKRLKVIAAKRSGIIFSYLRLGKTPLIREQYHEKVVNWIFSFLSYSLAILLIYFTLPFFFRIFPLTRSLADKLLGWVLIPIKSTFRGVVDYLPNLFTIIVIAFFTQVAIRILRFLALQLDRGNIEFKGFFRDWARPTFNILRILLYAFMFVVVFPYLPGSSSPVFQGVSVFLGILFSLGSTSAIGNMVAGMVITYMRPFKVGDRVKIGEVTGDVVEKGVLITRIMTIKNEAITVPNSVILASHTINYTTAAEAKDLILHTSVSIGYDSPWRTVHKLLIDAAMATPGIIKSKPPFVLQTSLGDFYITYEINAYTDKASEIPNIYSELHQQIQDQFNRAGVEILSPHYRSLRDGNASTVNPPQQDGSQKT